MAKPGRVLGRAFAFVAQYMRTDAENMPFGLFHFSALKRSIAIGFLADWQLEERQWTS
jgi:hypothetical protein